MLRTAALALAGFALSAALARQAAAADETPIRVGHCFRTINVAAAPYAVAQKMGWFTQEGLRLDLIPVPGGSDCMRFLGSGDIQFAVVPFEAAVVGRTQGVRARIFLTTLHGNLFATAVLPDSPVQAFDQLKGKTVGVFSMTTSGMPFLRAASARAGLDPDHDIRIAPVGEGAQAALMLRSGQVDAIMQLDVQLVTVENNGTRLRLLPDAGFGDLPAAGMVAMEETLARHRAAAAGLARAYLKGVAFTAANPTAAVRMLWEVYPQAKPAGKDEATALAEELRILDVRLPRWLPAANGVETRWGENAEEGYAAHRDFLLKWGGVKAAAPVADLITNDLIDDVNAFDRTRVAAQARAAH